MKTSLFYILMPAILLSIASCTSDDMVQNNQPSTAGSTDDIHEGTVFVSDNGNEKSATRTSMRYSDGAFFWEKEDRIFVKDDKNEWQYGNRVNSSGKPFFMFMMPGKYTGDSYTVYYNGSYAYGDQVYIDYSPTQLKPNDATHFGRTGDCGMATATRNGKQFKFRLDHKASYLVFRPYTTNPVLQKCVITQIEVEADNNIAGTYSLDATTGKLTGAGNNSKITLTTGGYGEEGFPLTNSVPDIATNGAYMVIAPGTHSLKVTYWIESLGEYRVRGCIIKHYPACDYKPNEFYDMAVHLDVKNYDHYKHYMWDAQQYYWYGHESEEGDKDASPKNNTDVRWYNEGGTHLFRFDATHSCSVCPNVNELMWYAMKGDPRWDHYRLYTYRNELFVGGMWFKKKDYIPGFNDSTDPNGVDHREGGPYYRNNGVSSDIPNISERNHYFFLPCLERINADYIQKNRPNGSMPYGWYYSSSGRGYHNAWFLELVSGSVRVDNTSRRDEGYIAVPFEQE